MKSCGLCALLLPLLLSAALLPPSAAAPASAASNAAATGTRPGLRQFIKDAAYTTRILTTMANPLFWIRLHLRNRPPPHRQNRPIARMVPSAAAADLQQPLLPVAAMNQDHSSDMAW